MKISQLFEAAPYTSPPKIVFHGSKNRAIKSFEKRKTKRYLLGAEFSHTANGFFFSTEYQDAKEYGRYVSAYRIVCKKPLVNGYIGIDRIPREKFDDLLYIFSGLLTQDDGYFYFNGMMTDIQVTDDEWRDGEWMYSLLAHGGLDWECLDNAEFVRRMIERGYDGTVVYEPDDVSKHSWFVVSPDQIEFIEEVDTN